MTREMTPRDAAKDLIRFYVLRGDTQEYLRYGQMGTSCKQYRAQIGGFLWSQLGAEDEYLGRKVRRLRADQIGVSEVGGEPCIAVFSLPELYEEIKREAETGTRQMSLFDALGQAVAHGC